jgi:phosphoribosylformylglycinamidine synthase
MNFANVSGGMEIQLDGLDGAVANVLFSEKPGLVLQLNSTDAISYLKGTGVACVKIGQIIQERVLTIKKGTYTGQFDIDHYRTVWRKTSDLLDREQTKKDIAILRAKNYRKQPLTYSLPNGFDGTYASLGLDPTRKTKSGCKAAIIREQGVNSDREMAYALYLAGFDVKDVHMTDLIAGREDLSDVSFIVFVGGFSNSDVLGSAKGWAGSFKFNGKARTALENFYKRTNTLSLGVCNGCQLMMELDLVYPDMPRHPKMHHNAGGKFECAFVGVDILENNSVLLANMAGQRMGIWMAHGEGRFDLENESDYLIPMKYAYGEFPGNPNGSSFAAAALVSKDGRHLAMMPHLERSLFPWNWPYKKGLNSREVTPWMIPFVNAREWVKSTK